MNIIKAKNIVKRFNEWRRGGGPIDYIARNSPKKLWIAIDTLVSFIEMNQYEQKYNEWMIAAAVGELHFANMQTECLENALEEIKSMTTDPLAIKIVETALERRELDKLIHIRKLFPNETQDV